MALTQAQLVVLKADILASPDLVGFPNNADGNFEIARLYNLAASPDFWVWRTSVPKHEIVSVQSTDADGVTTRSFIWAGNGFITRAAGEQAAWEELFNATLAVNAALPNVRQAFADIFSGTGNAASNRTHLLNVARRKATRAEKLFAAGTGTAAVPGTMGFEGAVSYQDVETARNL